jgi:hypothetical protein
MSDNNSSVGYYYVCFEEARIKVLSIVYFRMTNNKTMMLYNVLDYIMAGQRYNKQLTMGGTR